MLCTWGLPAVTWLNILLALKNTGLLAIENLNGEGAGLAFSVEEQDICVREGCDLQQRPRAGPSLYEVYIKRQVVATALLFATRHAALSHYRWFK